MRLISLVAAIDENFGLGKNNQLLCHLPADLQHFKRLTLGKPVIMGRNTYLSIGRPLPQRLNIVLTTQLIHLEGVLIANTLEEALALTNNAAETMIIGGAKVFKQAIPLATDIYLTVIAHQFAADSYFPQFNEQQWCCRSKTARQQDEKNPFDMTFYHYQRLTEVNVSEV